MADLYPNGEQVAVAWLRTTLATTGVATTLPDDTTWPANEFVQVTVTGGSPSVDVPRYSPVVSVDCWAVRPASRRPPWGQAAQLAERVRMATYTSGGVALAMPDGYRPARVMSVEVVAEPRRVPSDPSAYARWQVQIQVHWTPADVVIA